MIYPWNTFVVLLIFCNSFVAPVTCSKQDEEGYNSEETSEKTGFWEKVIPARVRKLFSHDEKDKHHHHHHHHRKDFPNEENIPNYDSYNLDDFEDYQTTPGGIPGQAVTDKPAGKPEDIPKTKKESGRLDFFGRDLINGAAKGVDAIGRKLGLKSASKGLDVSKDFSSGDSDKFKKKLQLIFPGTKWCGSGDRAVTEEDLGKYAYTDSCCRDHDNCFDAIQSGEIKYGLENTGLFSRQHCDCDEQFYKCLKDVNTGVSRKIGFTYFTILGPQCFREVPCDNGEYCRRDSRGIKVEYEWFDSPRF